MKMVLSQNSCTLANFCRCRREFWRHGRLMFAPTRKWEWHHVGRLHEWLVWDDWLTVLYILRIEICHRVSFMMFLNRCFMNQLPASKHVVTNHANPKNANMLFEWRDGQVPSALTFLFSRLKMKCVWVLWTIVPRMMISYARKRPEHLGP